MVKKAHMESISTVDSVVGFDEGIALLWDSFDEIEVTMVIINKFMCHHSQPS